MITVVVTYVFPAGRQNEAEGYLRELISATRREPGCRTYEVHRATDDDRTYLIYEQYEDEAALQAHRASDHFTQFGLNGLRTIAESRVAATYAPFA